MAFSKTCKIPLNLQSLISTKDRRKILGIKQNWKLSNFFPFLFNQCGIESRSHACMHIVYFSNANNFPGWLVLRATCCHIHAVYIIWYISCSDIIVTIVVQLITVRNDLETVFIDWRAILFFGVHLFVRCCSFFISFSFILL